MDFVSANRLRPWSETRSPNGVSTYRIFPLFSTLLLASPEKFHRSLQVLRNHVDDNSVKSLAPLAFLSNALLVIATRLIGIRSSNAFMDARLNSPELFLPLRKSIYVLQLQVER